MILYNRLIQIAAVAKTRNIAIPYQFAKHAMSIYANKHTSIDKPRQCTLGKASGASDGAASSEQQQWWIRTCQV